ncbi:neural cell adhesion molecule 1-like [Hemicordylus capensis]|uniref:neural cell adhesion molecule 1-like n=1 Tax=Hemicordylus capensis TaxID=884348 RepID=UPI002303D86A|nr:neural cell adhesion molecule 1-like [Hemicordylus capensis]
MGPGRFLIFMLAAGAVHCEKASLEIIPINGDVQKGEPAFFICKVKRGGETELTWYDPSGEEILEDSEEPYKRKEIDELSVGLNMTLSDPEKGGTFQCKGDFDSGLATAQIQIRVIQRPTFVTKMASEKEITEKGKVDFSCSATGIPQPTIKWIFQNQDISPSERISVERGSLEIKNIQPSDAGNYSCKASIEERKEVAFTHVTLKVKFAPRIELPTGDPLVIPAGNSIKYNFTVLANPSPSVTLSWKEKVFKDEDIKLVAKDQSIYIFAVEFPSPSEASISEAVITAVNELGQKERKLTIKEEIPRKGLGIGTILAIVLVVLLLVLLVIDVCCYYKRQRGLLMCLRSHIQGKTLSGTSTENNRKGTVVNVSGIEA